MSDDMVGDVLGRYLCKREMSPETFDAIKRAAGAAVIRMQQGDDPIEVTVDLATAAWIRGYKDGAREESGAEQRAYREAMSAISALMTMNPDKDTPGGLLLNGLAHVLDEYEQMKWPFDEPTPEEAAAFRAEQEQKSEKRETRRHNR